MTTLHSSELYQESRDSMPPFGLLGSSRFVRPIRRVSVVRILLALLLVMSLAAAAVERASNPNATVQERSLSELSALSSQPSALSPQPSALDH
jgi:hypothetical protein